MPNKNVFLDIYQKVFNGPELVIRGMKVKECRNIGLTINSIYPITSFKSRNLNLNYAKQEVLWYLRGNRFDTSICDIAGAWNDTIQPDGGINSNYGQTIFMGPKHFDWVISELVSDINSRRAVIILGEADKLNPYNTDHRCTMYINYHIRQYFLHQSVYMRSNDAIFGLTNDVFFFGLLHQMIYIVLKLFYPKLKLGDYYHHANSLHVYEKHYGMMESIINNKDWYNINYPTIYDETEVYMLRNKYCYLNKSISDIPTYYKFTKWLRS